VSADLEATLADWDGEAVIARFDRETAAWIFIALHSSALGPSTGGTRMRVYASPADGLRDAQRLARGMTAKWAAVDLPVGGGKAVLALSRPLADAERAGLLRRYGRLVESLRGAFATGEDLGTTPEDMAIIATQTSHVHGVESDGAVIDPGPFTARGVLRGIQAAARAVLGRDDLAGVRVLVQGVGDVGLPLARELRAAGAELLLSDVDAARVAAAARELGAAVVAPGEALTAPCAVLAPCAIGGILDAGSIARLACRVVAGSANNQLATDEDAERLHARGIVYVPDYVVNGGGALALGLRGRGVRDLDELMARMERIGEAVAEILAEAAAAGEPPLRAATRRVDRALAAARA
jgi:leucine dehydrogenase